MSQQGLDVESALRRSKVPEEKTQTMSKKVTCSDSSRSSLPKFGLVEKYQLAFNIADLLKNNRFLCEVRFMRLLKLIVCCFVRFVLGEELSGLYSLYCHAKSHLKFRSATLSPDIY